MGELNLVLNFCDHSKEKRAQCLPEGFKEFSRESIWAMFFIFRDLCKSNAKFREG